MINYLKLFFKCIQKLRQCIFSDMLKQIRDQAWAYTPSISSVPGFGIDLDNIPDEDKNSTSKVEVK